MSELLKPSSVRWHTTENYDASRVLKQHAMIHKIRKTPYLYEPYDSNASLCGKIMISEDGNTGIPWTEIDGEGLNTLTCCQICLRNYRTILKNYKRTNI
jgi:hypothetical protein